MYYEYRKNVEKILYDKYNANIVLSQVTIGPGPIKVVVAVSFNNGARKRFSMPFYEVEKISEEQFCKELILSIN